jgi:hypothetical protein
MSQAKMQKRQREKAQRERAAAKRERRATRAAEGGETDQDAGAAPTQPQGEVLAQLAALHKRFADEEIDFDTFEAAKAELLAQLDV